MTENAELDALEARLQQLERWIRGVVSWIGDHAIAALTIVGLAFYGGGLLVYSRFYGAFGLNADEAGLDYTTTLTRTVTAFFFWVATLFGIATLLFGIGILVFILVGIGRRALTAWRWVLTKIGKRATSEQVAQGADAPEGPSASDGESPSDEPPAEAANSAGVPLRGWRWLTRIAVIALVLVVLPVVFLGLALDTPDKLAERVKDGKEILPASESEIRTDDDLLDYWVDAYRNPLRIRIERVTVSPAEPDTKLPAKLNGALPYAYLGRSGDTIILYDAGGARTLRVPAALVVLSDPVGNTGTD